MTLYEFNTLDDEEEKLAAVLLNGEYVAMREETGCKCTLYQVGSFYVEISSGEKEDEVLKFRSLSSVDQLQPYLEEIDISALSL